MRVLAMGGNLPRLLSCACSILLIPISVIFDPAIFYALCVVNFVLFHGIWLSRYITEEGFAFTNEFFIREMRLPIILFAVCGLTGLILTFGV